MCKEFGHVSNRRNLFRESVFLCYCPIFKTHKDIESYSIEFTFMTKRFSISLIFKAAKIHFSCLCLYIFKCNNDGRKGKVKETPSNMRSWARSALSRKSLEEIENRKPFANKQTNSAIHNVDFASKQSNEIIKVLYHNLFHMC